MGSSSFTLFGLPNDLGHCRLGFTVTRKVGGAVRRNRVKRLLREIFRRHRTRLEPPMDLVVNARPLDRGQEPAASWKREFLRCVSTPGARGRARDARVARCSALLRGYKRFVSPLLPPACRFHPTCSEYAMQAVELHGVAARRGPGAAAPAPLPSVQQGGL